MASGTKLVLASSREPDNWVPVDTEEFIIGRSRVCNMTLGASQVSRQHCRIFLQDGSYLLEDLKSSGGTWVGKQKVNKPTKIEDGMEFRIGDTSVKCRFEEEARPSRAAPAVRDDEVWETELESKASADLDSGGNGARQPAEVDPSGEVEAEIEPERPPKASRGHDRSAAAHGASSEHEGGPVLWLSPEPGAWFAVSPDFVIGRAKDAGLKLNSPAVSRKHGTVHVRDDGFWVEDLGSSSGIRRGDEVFKEPFQVHDGDELGFGDCAVICHIRDAELGPPEDAGQIPFLLRRNGEVFRLATGKVTIGSNSGSDLVVPSQEPVSLALFLARRPPDWVGLLADESSAEKEPVVIPDGGEFRAGDEPLRLVLPRLPAGERRLTSHAEPVLMVSYQEGEWVPITNEEFIIGRSKKNDLAVDCPTVSRQHCAVTRRDGAFFIEDLGGRGGLWIDEELVRGAREIKDDDRFRIGDQVLHFSFRPA